ncbi:MAG: hypothetical protein E6R05_07335 [Candidatus Moraniibacteriota bacterium]|nr:MAG: hypothetical protein E6R05_07335 [Candidatus Moranbacteria bacterium]
MRKPAKKKMPRDPKKAMQFLLDHEFKHPQTEAIKILKSVDITSEKAQKNVTTMRDADGKEILYVILEDQKKNKNKGKGS